MQAAVAVGCCDLLLLLLLLLMRALLSLCCLCLLLARADMLRWPGRVLLLVLTQGEPAGVSSWHAEVKDVPSNATG